MTESSYTTGTLHEEQLPNSVTDEDLVSLSSSEAKALFARVEAEGAGDFELSSVPEGSSMVGFVESFNEAEPDWPETVFSRVDEALRSPQQRKLSFQVNTLEGTLQEQIQRANQSLQEVKDRLSQDSNGI